MQDEAGGAAKGPRLGRRWGELSHVGRMALAIRRTEQAAFGRHPLPANALSVTCRNERTQTVSTSILSSALPRSLPA